jgi:hypothetical protein
LEAVGLRGARPYRGGITLEGNRKFFNWRTATAWALRNRLDPRYTRPISPGSDLRMPQAPFAIQAAHVALMRKELQGLRYEQNDRNQLALEPKEKFVKRLKHSPDFADVLTQSFAFAA